MPKLKNRNPQIVDIINHDPSAVRFKCKKCGQIWAPSYKEGGRFYRGSWQCPNKCEK